MPRNAAPAPTRGTAVRGEPARARTFKFSEATLEALTRIAERENLYRGCVPCRAEAVRWLIARDAGASRNAR